MTSTETHLRNIGTSLLNSYSMVFFSKSRVLAVILVFISYFDPVAGLSGSFAVLCTLLFANLIGFNRQNILSGVYGFNSLLAGLGIGVYYQFSAELFILILFASLLTLFLTLFFEGVIGKYGLPFLTLPFLIGFWLVSLAAQRYTGLHLSERGIYTYNELLYWGGFPLLGAYNWLNGLNLPLALSTYFKSLSAIFFQYHLLPGILIALGLIYYSRIAFTLSLLGFYSAYLFYHFIGADLNELNYSFIGFNYILTAIAVGGFFIISSRLSFLWVVLLTPLISILLSGSTELLAFFQLSTYSLPFNAVVLLFLYMLRFREKPSALMQLVAFQEFSPERNLYSQKNSKTRFMGNLYLPVGLPFMGEWEVTQGHSGQHTHKDAWKHAWDFEIRDEKGKTFSGNGSALADYYCYNKPVIAPADGWVVEIVDGVDDNFPGVVNLHQNWGNAIILKHVDGLYSKICHLRKESFCVEKGAFVKKGEKLALCGNSGRSPEPHIHFQLQAYPYIGSATLDFPVGRYLLGREKHYELVTWGKPQLGDKLANIDSNACLNQAFNFVPGQTVSFLYKHENGPEKTASWKVETDLYNYTYLHCAESGSKAYFRNETDLHFFTWFEGDRDSLLYSFYLGAYKLARGYYTGLIIHDEFPLFIMKRGIRKVLQDFLAPFHIFIHSEFRMEYLSMEDEIGQTRIRLRSVLTEKSALSSKELAAFDFYMDHNRIEKFTVTRNTGILTARYLENPSL